MCVCVCFFYRGDVAATSDVGGGYPGIPRLLAWSLRCLGLVLSLLCASSCRGSRLDPSVAISLRSVDRGSSYQ